MDSATLLRLVSEATRHAILERLRQGGQSVTSLVEGLQDEQSNVSHHLRLLRDAGLVAARRDGRTQVYSLADAEVGRVLGEVARLADRLERVAYTSRLGIPTDPGFHGYG